MMKSLSNRLHKIALHLPFDPAYWIEKNRYILESGNLKIWEELSDEEFELVSDYIDAIEGTTGEEFTQDLSALTDEQFEKFDKLTEDGMEPNSAYQLCLTSL